MSVVLVNSRRWCALNLLFSYKIYEKFFYNLYNA